VIRCRGDFELRRAADNIQLVDERGGNDELSGLMKAFNVKNLRLLKRHDIKPVVVRIGFVVL
jgi:hypothetical protein